MSDPFGSKMAQLSINQSFPKRLIVALDFGTTYSGVAYCFPDQREAKPYAVRNWPGSLVTVPKIPTVVRYDSEDGAKFQWGALLKASHDIIIGIKLLLDPSQPMPYYAPQTDVNAQLNMLPPFKSPKHVAADFMRAIKSHAISQIATKVPQKALDLFTTEYVLSVPALWSDAAKNATLEAAEIAGLFPITLIKEPEAAALYSIRQLDTNLNHHDVVVICDAGGGTVDLISYEIEETSPKLQLKEVVPGKGRMVGSIMLNRRFKDALEQLIPAEKWKEFKNSRAMIRASQQFENEIKPGFTGDLDEEFYVNFPGAGLTDNPDRGLMSNEWTMSGTDVKAIFDPVIKDILHLIDQQVQKVRAKAKEVKAIFLVGGFGGSQYLRRQVERAYPFTKIVQPDDAWSAIAKGSALSRMPNNAVVSSRCAVRHYGTVVAMPFQSSIDAGQSASRDPYTGQLQAQRMSWFINIGDDIKRAEKLRIAVYRRIPENYTAAEARFKHVLYEYNQETAPRHPPKDQELKINCVLYTNVFNVPKSKFVKEEGWSESALSIPGKADPVNIDAESGNGKTHWKVNYDLLISFESAAMTFSMEIDGETCGSVEAHFEH